MNIAPILLAAASSVVEFGPAHFRTAAAITESLGWTLLHFLWQGLAVAGVLGFFLLVARNASPLIRYSAACIALFVMSAGFAATFAWQTARSEAASTEAPIAHPTPLSPVRLIPSGVATRVNAVEASILNMDEPTIFHFGTWHVAVTRMRHWLSWIVAIWAIGAAALSLRLVAGWSVIRELRRTGTELQDPAWIERLSTLRRRLGISAPVRLLSSATASVPLVIGWLAPIVLVPAGLLTGLSAPQLEALLAHELVHVRRHDYLVNLLQNAVETLLFYHPAVWWVSAQIRQEREHCCDDIAATLCGSPLDYARALTALAEHRRTTSALGLAATGGSLINRVRRLVAVNQPNPRIAGWPIAALIIAAGIAIATLTTIKAVGQVTPGAPAPVSSSTTDGPGKSSGASVSAEKRRGRENRIVDAQGRPIQGAKFEVYRHFNGKHSAVGVTDEEGRFEYPSETPAADPFSIRVWAPGFITRLFLGNQFVHVRREGKLVPDVLQMDRAATIKGRVIGADGKPLPNVSLFFGVTTTTNRNSQATDPQTYNRLFTADAEGRFEVQNVHPGNVFLCYRRDQKSPDTVPAPVRFAVTHLRADDGQTLENVVLDLAKSTCVLEGKLVDGIPGAEIHIRPIEGYGYYDVTVTANTDGTFRVDGLPPDEFNVSASLHGTGLGESARVNLKPNAAMSVRLVGYTPGHAPPPDRKVEPKWGPAYGGLQAAVVIDPPRDVYHIGDVIDVRILVRNVSNAAKEFTETSLGNALDVTDPDGKHRSLNFESFWGFPWTEKYRLAAGQDVLLKGSFRIRLRNPRDTGQPQELFALAVEPGREYRLIANLAGINSLIVFNAKDGVWSGSNDRWVTGESILKIASAAPAKPAAAADENPPTPKALLVRMFVVKNVRASTVAEIIKDVYRDLLSADEKARVRKPEKRPFRRWLSVDTDNKSNTIRIACPEGLMKNIEQIIEQLDQRPAPRSR